MADKVRFGRAASDSPAGWARGRLRVNAARGALYGFGCGLPLTGRPGRLPVALPVSPVAHNLADRQVPILAQGSWRRLANNTVQIVCVAPESNSDLYQFDVQPFGGW